MDDVNVMSGRSHLSDSSPLLKELDFSIKGFHIVVLLHL